MAAGTPGDGAQGLGRLALVAEAESGLELLYGCCHSVEILEVHKPGRDQLWRMSEFLEVCQGGAQKFQRHRRHRLQRKIESAGDLGGGSYLADLLIPAFGILEPFPGRCE